MSDTKRIAELRRDAAESLRNFATSIQEDSGMTYFVATHVVDAFLELFKEVSK